MSFLRWGEFWVSVCRLPFGAVLRSRKSSAAVNGWRCTGCGGVALQAIISLQHLWSQCHCGIFASEKCVWLKKSGAVWLCGTQANRSSPAIQELTKEGLMSRLDAGSVMPSAYQSSQFTEKGGNTILVDYCLTKRKTLQLIAMISMGLNWTLKFLRKPWKCKPGVSWKMEHDSEAEKWTPSY